MFWDETSVGQAGVAWARRPRGDSEGNDTRKALLHVGYLRDFMKKLALGSQP